MRHELRGDVMPFAEKKIMHEQCKCEDVESSSPCEARLHKLLVQSCIVSPYMYIILHRIYQTG